jgi:hypothetical protein
VRRARLQLIQAGKQSPVLAQVAAAPSRCAAPTCSAAWLERAGARKGLVCAGAGNFGLQLAEELGNVAKACKTS